MAFSIVVEESVREPFLGIHHCRVLQSVAMLYKLHSTRPFNSTVKCSIYTMAALAVLSCRILIRHDYALENGQDIYLFSAV